MTRNFLNLSRKECLDYYQIIINNSDRHFFVSERIAEDKQYGIAISHLILGTEELVKALIIYLDGEGLEIRKIKGIQKFFKDHTIRHIFSGIFNLMSKFLKPIMEIASRIKELIHNSEARKSMTELETSVINYDELRVQTLAKEWGENIAKQYADKFEYYYDFWTNAETYKQKGFYVDYDNEILTPEQLTEANYIQAKEITNSFRNECKILINYVQNLQERDKKIFSKTINKDKRIYNFLELIISDQK